MKDKKIGNEIKWYKPFALVKRVKDLEKLTEEQFLIINNYKDELQEKKDIIQQQKKIIADLEQQLQNLKENIVIAPDEETEIKHKRGRKKKEETIEKKEPAKRGRKKKEEK